MATLFAQLRLGVAFTCVAESVPYATPSFGESPRSRSIRSISARNQ